MDTAILRLGSSRVSTLGMARTRSITPPTSHQATNSESTVPVALLSHSHAHQYCTMAVDIVRSPSAICPTAWPPPGRRVPISSSALANPVTVFSNDSSNNRRNGTRTTNTRTDRPPMIGATSNDAAANDQSPRRRRFSSPTRPPITPAPTTDTAADRPASAKETPAAATTTAISARGRVR